MCLSSARNGAPKSVTETVTTSTFLPSHSALKPCSVLSAAYLIVLSKERAQDFPSDTLSFNTRTTETNVFTAKQNDSVTISNCVFIGRSVAEHCVGNTI